MPSLEDQVWYPTHVHPSQSNQVKVCKPSLHLKPGSSMWTAVYHARYTNTPRNLWQTNIHDLWIQHLEECKNKKWCVPRNVIFSTVPRNVKWQGSKLFPKETVSSCPATCCQRTTIKQCELFAFSWVSFTYMDWSFETLLLVSKDKEFHEWSHFHGNKVAHSACFAISFRACDTLHIITYHELHNCIN